MTPPVAPSAPACASAVPPLSAAVSATFAAPLSAPASACGTVHPASSTVSSHAAKTVLFFCFISFTHAFLPKK